MVFCKNVIINDFKLSWICSKYFRVIKLSSYIIGKCGRVHEQIVYKSYGAIELLQAFK